MQQRTNIDDGRAAGPSRRSAIARIVAFASTIVLCIATVARLGGSQPTTVESDLRVGFLAVLGGLSTLTVIALLFRSRQMLWSLLPLGATVAIVLAASWTETFHWNLSRDDFNSVASAGETRCSQGCDLGRWRIDGVQQFDSAVVLWSAEEGCYSGYGFARPTAAATAASDPVEEIRADLVAADLRSDIVSVRPWRDGWYEYA